MHRTTAFRAAVKLKPFLVPEVDIRRTFAFLESDFIAMIVRPVNSEPATDGAITLKDLQRLLSHSNHYGFAMAGGDIKHGL